MTGVYTGRSPKDKFFVMDETTKDTIWWTSDEYKNDNKPVTKAAWKELIGGKLSMNGAGPLGLTAMIAASNEGEEWLEQLLPYLSANLDFVAGFCARRIPKIKTWAPDATYLMWLDCRALGLSNGELHDFMIHKAGLGLNDGSSFGRSLNGFMRLNAACPRSVLKQAMTQLEAAVNAL